MFSDVKCIFPFPIRACLYGTVRYGSSSTLCNLQCAFLTCLVHRHREALQHYFLTSQHAGLVPVAHWSAYWSKSPHQGEHQRCRVHRGTSSWKSRAVHSSRRCQKEWQVLRPLQGGWRCPQPFLVPASKQRVASGSSSPPLALPLHGLLGELVLFSSPRAMSPVKASPPPPRNFNPYIFSPFKFSLSLWCAGPFPAAWMALADKRKSQRSYWQKMESEEGFRNMYPTAISVLNLRMKTAIASALVCAAKKNGEEHVQEKFKGELKKRDCCMEIFLFFIF